MTTPDEVLKGLYEETLVGNGPKVLELTETGLEIGMEPQTLLAETGVETIGKFLMGTVMGDVHDIGKNLVNIMLEGAGFEVIDLGVQVAPEKFVEQIQEHNPDIVGFSAFLTTTMPMFKANIN